MSVAVQRVEPFPLIEPWSLDTAELDAERLRWELAARGWAWWDLELDGFVDEQREIDRAVLAGFDRGESVDLDMVFLERVDLARNDRAVAFAHLCLTSKN